MTLLRLAARLDVKGPNLVKGVHLEGLRKLGDPHAFARRYYDAGIDELLYVDVVASLYGRNSLLDLVARTAQDVFVPLTVAGGLRSVEDARAALRAGADKVAINTAALARPALLRELADSFGAQCVVLGVEAKRLSTGGWEAYTDNGREHSGRQVTEWVEEACSLGAGEVLVTSVDQEGTGRGVDQALIQAVRAVTNVPVVASGGVRSAADVIDAAAAGADAVAMAHALHYQHLELEALRAALADAGHPVRRPRRGPDLDPAHAQADGPPDAAEAR